MKVLVSFLLGLIISAPVFADLPRLNGSFSKVLRVDLVPSQKERGTHVVATVRYRSVCDSPTALVVIPSKKINFNYLVVETRVPLKPDEVACQAYRWVDEMVHVALIPGPQPVKSDIKVNNVSPQ